ncbi:MAG: VTT domain-containing protein [Eubacteriales bacterium]|nr:VTT domain-containing protein [Eubacteriales bacterium]
MSDNQQKKRNRIKNVILIAVWVLFIVICLRFRGEITVEKIMGYTPKKPVLAAFVMLILYALKSVSVVIYSPIFYVACGIMFPLPVALLINTIGTFIMVLIPYILGKKAGEEAMQQLIEKNEKLGMLKDISSRNPVFLSFFTRVVHVFPNDPVGMYFGSCGVDFKKYALGSMLGLLPSVITFTVMGMSVDDPTSPEFLISLAIEAGLILLSLPVFHVFRVKNKNSH